MKHFDKYLTSSHLSILYSKELKYNFVGWLDQSQCPVHMYMYVGGYFLIDSVNRSVLVDWISNAWKNDDIVHACHCESALQ